MAETKRLDIFLADTKIAPSRQKAKELIQNGQVFINDTVVTKPSFLCTDETIVDIRGNITPYVGRGGLKLEKALQYFKLNTTEKTALDIGSSTGGFTQCLLLNGIKKVYSVDVGTTQLHHSLRQDSRVVVMENTDIRAVTTDILGEQVDIAVCDVSFISLSLIFPCVFPLLKDDGYMVTLIKPQFEAGKGNVPKSGIIKSAKIHEKAIGNVLNTVKLNGFTCLGITYSPVKGGNGNLEYLALLQKSKNAYCVDIKSVVAQAHENVR